METKTFIAPNISCGHCTHTIEDELGDLAGVASVSAEIDTKKVTVAWAAPTSWDEINALLSEIGFPPQQLIQL
ncbi:MAG: heavy-metal-associated domain-containing protein [Candidatus Promineifilaceae bacterium]